MRAAGRGHPFRRGDVLMETGARSHEVIVIDTGVVKVLLPSWTGEDVIIGINGPGMLVGELGVLERRPRSATVVGLVGGSATHLSGDVFRELVGSNSDVRAYADATRHQRQRNADRRHVALASMSVRDRIVLQLLDWAKVYGQPTSGGVVLRGLRQVDLAGAIAASRQHVEAALHTLREEGLVETGRMRFVLIDPVHLGRSLGKR